MKIKNLRIFLTSALIFAVIGTFNACRDSKIKEQSKPVKTIENSVADLNFDDVFVPVEDIKINLKPEVSSTRRR